jgi:uroporphyrinogen-III synthase
LTPGDRVLVPHGDISDPALVTVLGRRGAVVTEAVAYRTVEAPAASRTRLAAALDDGAPDVIVATSGSTARGLVVLAGDGARTALLATPLIAAGARTAQVAADAGFSQVLTAPAPDAASLAEYTAWALGAPPIADPDLDLDPAPVPGGAR